VKTETKLSVGTLLMTAGTAALAQPTTSPGGGVTWAIAGVAFAAGVAVGYYLGKNSSSKDDDDK
jgi:uncharacterized membrane protein YfcA